MAVVSGAVYSLTGGKIGLWTRGVPVTTVAITMTVGLDEGDQLIARGYSWRVPKLQTDAMASYLDDVSQGRPEPKCTVSVFGTQPQGPGVDMDAERRRVESAVRAAVPNSKKLSFITRRALEEANFSVVLNEPPPGHYDLDLGVALDDDALGDRLGLLMALFDEGEKVDLR